jgi:hypothetical protein
VATAKPTSPQIQRKAASREQTCMILAFAPEQIEQWPLARLQPYAKNAKTNGPDQVAKIAASMAEFGWTPCLVAEDGELNGDLAPPEGELTKTSSRPPAMVPPRPGPYTGGRSAVVF